MASASPPALSGSGRPARCGLSLRRSRHQRPQQTSRQRKAATAAVNAAGRLAALWADTPDAVTADGTGFTVSASSGPQELFARAARVPGLTPVRLERPAKGRTTLVLRPPPSRVLARALFSPDIAFVTDRGGSP